MVGDNDVETVEQVTTEQIKAEIQTALDAMALAWNERKLETFLEHYAKDAQLIVAAVKADGCENIHAFYKDQGRFAGKIGFVVEEVLVAGDTHAYACGTRRWGEKYYGECSYISLLMQKMPEGTWCILREHRTRYREKVST